MAQRVAMLLQVFWMEVEEDPTGGVHLLVGVRGAADTPLGKAEMGRVWLLGLGRMAPPRPFSIFFISFSFHFFSDFLNCFKSFANMLQNHSNHFPKFSKITSIVLKQ
jgi:hypothetical protein